MNELNQHEPSLSPEKAFFYLTFLLTDSLHGEPKEYNFRISFLT